MLQYDTVIKKLGALGLAVFVLYCIHIDFMPSDVSMGDVIPLILVLAHFAIAALFHLSLFVLSGAFFWYLIKAGWWPISLAASLIRASPANLTRKSSVSPSNAPARRCYIFFVPVSFSVAFAGGLALFLLLLLYSENRPNIPIVKQMPYSGYVLAMTTVAAACFSYLATIHFLIVRKHWPFSKSLVIVSPVYRFTARLYNYSPSHYERNLLILLAISSIFFYPGGYAGLLQKSAEAAGLRRDGAVILLMNPHGYAATLMQLQSDKCAGYSLFETQSSIRLDGVILEFHGIGKRSRVSLPSLLGRSTRLELPSDDVRLVDTTLIPNTRNLHIWYARYSLVAKALNYAPDSFKKGLSELLQFEKHKDLYLLALPRFMPTPNQSADAEAKLYLSCFSSIHFMTPDVVEIMLTPVRTLDWGNPK